MLMYERRRFPVHRRTRERPETIFKRSGPPRRVVTDPQVAGRNTHELFILSRPNYYRLFSGGIDELNVIHAASNLWFDTVNS